ncbi:transglutaminase-like domain-containing protein [Parabacteroides sp. OttesenSCG-928-G06]|nr:transglutaminase-like domain-containing protein [Parabacteroides sp. OttesenSCG-928-G06]
MSCSPYAGIPSHYHALLDEAIVHAGENAVELKKALDEAPREQKEGMAFLIAYMPEADLQTLSGAFLLKNVDLAYTARNRFPWAQSVPDSVFLNDVLPYISMDETREEWREDFYNRFSEYVKDCQTLKEAIYAVNRNIRNEVGVDYNTKRKRPNQSPSESMEIGMASCSGLSILLTDAFRAVGIPSRIAGTARWHDNRGNHTWCEVWLDGQWYFTEYYIEDLDRAWFMADAGKAKPGNPEYAVFATSYKPAESYFPMVWNRRSKDVPGIDVTQHYIDVYNKVIKDKANSGNFVKMQVKMYKDPQHTKLSDDRLKVNVDIFKGADQVGGGSTAGPTQDMNDVLEFLVEKNSEYTLKYFPGGEAKEKTVKIGEEAIEVILFP